MKKITSSIITIALLAVLLVATPALPAHAAGIVVNSDADNTTDNSQCTLREAITNANNDAATYDDCTGGSGSDVITFDNVLGDNYTITLSSQLPAVTSTIIINGNGATNTIIQANAAPDTAIYRVFEVGASGNLTLNRLTVRHGKCTGSCTVLGQVGGGIYNAGTLTINNSLVSANISTFDQGGGLINDGGTVTITGSTISDNSSNNAGAGIANNNGTMTISNSTIANNSAVGNVAGGLYNGGTLNIYNSTISGNTSNSGIWDGDNIYQAGGALNLYNTIIANSATHGDCGIGGGTVSATNSLIESTGVQACGLTNTNGNIIGSDPNLGLFTGSPAYLHLKSGSIAINAGNDTICAAAPVNGLDQRGFARPFGAHCDIGAYEHTPVSLPTPWVGSVSVTSDKNVVAVGRPHIGAEVMTFDSFSSGSLSAYVPMLFKDGFDGSYDSALYVQNVDSANSANITIKYYDNAGTLSCTVNGETIAPLASKGYWLPSLGCLSAGWVGGVVVSSDHPIVAIGRPHIGAEVMTYNSFSSGSLSSYIPMLFKDAFGGSYDSAFYIQNVDPTNTANITIKYYDNAGNLSCTVNDETIAPFASKGYWVPGQGCLSADWVGGVVVTSDYPIVTVGRPHIGTQITTYNGFSAGTTSSYTPMLFKDAFGGSYDSAFYVQNVHPANTANITIKYYDSAGNLSCTVNGETIAPFASKGYWVPNQGCLSTGWVGGVVVTSDQPIVAVGRPHIAEQVTTYNGFTSGNAGSFLPMLFKDAFGGSYDAAFYIQNTEASAAAVTVKYYDDTGALTCTRYDSIPSLSTLGLWLPSLTCLP